ncbi:hypothetical protein TNCV_1854271 [Trichonephila clavipes]|nr:hypothetical protein TNCV_1854271 [Trichonephila clavipes]
MSGARFAHLLGSALLMDHVKARCIFSPSRGREQLRNRLAADARRHHSTPLSAGVEGAEDVLAPTPIKLKTPKREIFTAKRLEIDISAAPF